MSADPWDALAAMKEFDKQYIGSRSVRITRSTWADKSVEAVKKKEKEKSKRQALGLK